MENDTVRRRNCLACNRRYTTQEVIRYLDNKKDAKKQSA